MILAACAGTVDASNIGIDGNFALVAVDRASIPVKIGSTFALRGTVSFTNNGRFTLEQTDSTAGSAAVTTSSTGNWIVQDLSLTMRPEPNGFLLGIWIPRDTVRITMLNAHEYTYARR